MEAPPLDDPPAAPRRRPRIAITLGDPNGIGPEVVLRCITDARLLKYMEPLVIGSAHVLGVHATKLGYRDARVHVVTSVPERAVHRDVTILDITRGEKLDVAFGRITEAGGRLAMQAVEVATDLALEGDVDAVVTAPISKEAIARAGYDDPGHTEFLARRTGADTFTMMMVAGDLRVGLVTGHIALRDVPAAVTEDAILDKVRIINGTLVEDFGIPRPRIAVLGLNPHAGDGGVIGREELDTIVPAIERGCREGYHLFGPFPADGFFAVGAYRGYDAVLAMYHDQGLVPFKTMAFDTGVNYTAGLPIVRTSPDHGTAYNIAGEGKASPGSMRSALYLAIDVARRRAAAREERRKAG